MKIQTKKGLDIPILGKPVGEVQPFAPRGEAGVLSRPKSISLNLEPFEDLRFRLLHKVGDHVEIGQPIAEDKASPGRVFASPGSGTIEEIRRGLKRRILDIVLRLDEKEAVFQHPVNDPKAASREQLLDYLKKGGMFAKIRQRPFNLLADPSKAPRSIFVKALESAPFVPSAEMQVEGNEETFQLGLTVLSKLTDGPVHLVYHTKTTCRAFLDAKDVSHHTAEGPHPIANHSLHIQCIDPIKTPEDVVWTLTALDVVAIGHLIKTGQYRIERVVSIAGPGVVEDQTGYFMLREGYPIEPLLEGRVKKGWMRYISGDPLMGKKVECEDYMGYSHTTFCIIPENNKREFAHFFRLGVKKFSMSRAYLSGHVKDRLYPFTTNQHGEPRAFMDSSMYKKVMPMQIPTMFLVKAVMAEDLDLAESLGLLEVAPEDFALPTFVDPSKIVMTDIIHEGLKEYAKEVLE